MSYRSGTVVLLPLMPFACTEKWLDERVGQRGAPPPKRILKQLQEQGWSREKEEAKEPPWVKVL